MMFEVNLSRQANKQRFLFPLTDTRGYKEIWDLSDARVLVKDTRLGFELYPAVEPLNPRSLQSRYPAAGPLQSELPFPRYLAARPMTALDSHPFSSFTRLLPATEVGFFSGLPSSSRSCFQQPATVKAFSSRGLDQQNFLFTPSESVLPLAARRPGRFSGSDTHTQDTSLAGKEAQSW